MSEHMSEQPNGVGVHLKKGSGGSLREGGQADFGERFYFGELLVGELGADGVDEDEDLGGAFRIAGGKGGADGSAEGGDQEIGLFGADFDGHGTILDRNCVKGVNNYGCRR
jgi:hypothetical protein